MSYGKVQRHKDPLEIAADEILAADLKNPKSNKSKSCDILSDSQLARRQRRELPFTDLSVKDKLKLGIQLEGGINDD